VRVERTGARPRKDTRRRVLAALTAEPATATQIAERAGIPGRERGWEAALVLARLEATGLAIREAGWRRVARWRAAPGACPDPVEADP
jgi:hypothetical protein